MDMNSIHANTVKPSMIKNTEAGKIEGQVKEKANRSKDKFILGTSGCAFEPAVYISELLGNTDEQKCASVRAMFANPLTTIETTDNGGRSLKVMFEIGNEIKFCGFITHGDKSMHLLESHIAPITKHIAEEVLYRACTAEELVEAFTA